VGNTALDFPVEIDDWFIVFYRSGISGPLRHLHRQHMIGGEPRRHALQSREAANQKSSSDQQHQRKRQFGNHQQAAQTVAPQV